MKKEVIGLLLSAALFTGCKQTTDYCDRIIDFVILNQTEIELTVRYMFSQPEETFVVFPEETETVSTRVELIDCKNKHALEDSFAGDWYIPYGKEVPDGGDGYWYNMSVEDGDGGELIVHDDIWLRKHWTYTSDNFNETYTLVVTPALLAEFIDTTR